MKCTAYGTSPEELSMQDAAIAGAQAGRRGNGASLNPYQDHTPEHAKWEACRMQAMGESLARSVC